MQAAELLYASVQRLFDEIRAAGCAGGYTQLQAFVQRVRPTPPPAPVICFETPAGRQAQVDFARFVFPWGVRYALLVVLGYLPISRTGAMFFFQLMTRRYEHASTVLTSNKGFEEWARSLATRSWPPR